MTLQDSKVRKLQEIVFKQIQNVAEDLKSILSESSSSDRVKFGTWSNKSGILVAYVSYFPRNDSSERSIDATIGLVLTDRVAKFTTDISWSDGKVIIDIVERDLVFDAFDELLSKVIKESGIASAALGEQMKALLFT